MAEGKGKEVEMFVFFLIVFIEFVAIFSEPKTCSGFGNNINIRIRCTMQYIS